MIDRVIVTEIGPRSLTVTGGRRVTISSGHLQGSDDWLRRLDDPEVQGMIRDDAERVALNAIDSAYHSWKNDRTPDGAQAMADAAQAWIALQEPKTPSV